MAHPALKSAQTGEVKTEFRTSRAGRVITNANVSVAKGADAIKAIFGPARVRPSPKDLRRREAKGNKLLSDVVFRMHFIGFSRFMGCGQNA